MPIVDRWGNDVANTYTLNSDFGSGVANAIQPGKRMLSSMSPTILVDVVDFQLTAQQSVAAPRFHHQGMPANLITYDGAFPRATLEALRQRGYTVEPYEWPLGDAQLIVRTATGWDAAADPRGRGEVRRLP